MKRIEVIRSGNTNCYLINTGNQNILIDTGTTADSNFLKRLEEKINLTQIDLVVLTHGHYDHVGYAPILQKEYEAKVAIHKKDVAMITNASMDFPKAKGVFSAMIRKQTLSALEKAAYTAFTPDFVIESETLSDYPDIQFISLPGHTPGSIGILYDNNLFAGDLVMNMPLPSLSWFAEDFTIMQKSLRKIQQLNIRRVYPGHGRDFSGRWLKYIR
jgi:hydroxyacylglutathione hydrolase